jgi:anti-sigma regulatory factor (Ser/Thr protein kinase)
MEEMSVKVDSSVNAPGLSRSRLVPMRQTLGARYDDVVLIVSELVSNSVRHGASQDIEVRVSAHDGWIRVAVTEDGPGFAVDAPRGEGLGLTIVERLADRWGMQKGSQRFTVWAELAAETV